MSTAAPALITLHLVAQLFVPGLAHIERQPNAVTPPVGRLREGCEACRSGRAVSKTHFLMRRFESQAKIVIPSVLTWLLGDSCVQKAVFQAPGNIRANTSKQPAGGRRELHLSGEKEGSTASDAPRFQSRGTIPRGCQSLRLTMSCTCSSSTLGFFPG
jgi:hypothetical protein